MIYILEYYDNIFDDTIVQSVWDVDNGIDVEREYMVYLIALAKGEFNLTINTHWGNAMNHKDHNYHLSEEEYKKAEKEWDKMLKKKNKQWFIKEVLKGRQLKFKQVYF